ncbi:hypothetical protein Q3G72_031903 [Acer saccharum]|nr:hypothetical protein Q3G72_031903 [Acer saccharum]
MLGEEDLLAFAKHVGELREEDTVTQTRSSSRASEHPSTDVVASSSVLAATAPAPAPVLAIAPIRLTYVRFVRTTQTMGHDVEHACGGTAEIAHQETEALPRMDQYLLPSRALMQACQMLVHSQQDTIAVDSALYDPTAIDSAPHDPTAIDSASHDPTPVPDAAASDAI